MRLVLAALGLGLLSACGTSPYVPTEYPLREGLIPTLDVAGTVAVSNAQASGEPFVVYSYMGTKLASDLKTITQTMVEQTDKELKKAGQAKPGDAKKTIALKVDSLKSEYIAFFWKSKIAFHATLGDGQTLDFDVPHSSGVVLQDLNGCIAEGVMTLLRDEKVRAYLAH